MLPVNISSFSDSKGSFFGTYSGHSEIRISEYVNKTMLSVVCDRPGDSGVVLKRTVVVDIDGRFDNLSGSHLQKLNAWNRLELHSPDDQTIYKTMLFI